MITFLILNKYKKLKLVYYTRMSKLMKHAHIDVLNHLKLAIIKKRHYFVLKRTKKYMKFIKYLLDLGLLSGYEKGNVGKNSVIFVFLKYSQSLLSALKDFEITSKISKKIKISSSPDFSRNTNYIFSSRTVRGTKEHTRLLARLR